MLTHNEVYEVCFCRLLTVLTWNHFYNMLLAFQHCSCTFKTYIFFFTFQHFCNCMFVSSSVIIISVQEPRNWWVEMTSNILYPDKHRKTRHVDYSLIILLLFEWWINLIKKKQQQTLRVLIILVIVIYNTIHNSSCRKN